MAMEFSIGFRGDGFVLLASDTSAARSIMMFKQGMFMFLSYILYWYFRKAQIDMPNNQIK